MTRVSALARRVDPRALISLLFTVTAGVAALESGPLDQAIDSLIALSAPTAPRPAAKVADLDHVQPFYLHAVSAAERERAIHCMTDAIYYEAANEPQAGQRAVAQVVVNRVRDKHFPKSVCGVVYQGWERRTGCQFSFVCDGSITRRHADPVLWTRLRPLAEQALSGYVAPQVGTATHYYADYVKPNWVRSVARIAEIGQHIFCSWKGKAGLPSALDEPYQGGELAIAQAALDGVRAEAEHTAKVTRRFAHHRIEIARHGRVHSRLYA